MSGRQTAVRFERLVVDAAHWAHRVDEQVHHATSSLRLRELARIAASSRESPKATPSFTSTATSCLRVDLAHNRADDRNHVSKLVETEDLTAGCVATYDGLGQCQ